MHDDDDPIQSLRRRREQKSRNRALALIAAAVILVAVAVFSSIALFAIKAKRDDEKSKEAVETKDLTHEELHAYLLQRGVKCWMYPDDGLSVIFTFGKDATEAEGASKRYRLTRIGVYSLEDVVRCEKVGSASYARDLAGADPVNKFAWGAFVFIEVTGPDGKSSRSHLDAIRRALKSK